MYELTYLADLLIIFVVAIVVVLAFHRLRLPAIAGFILSGLLVGPRGLGFIADVHQVEVLAEIGVALLLFGIGLELPVSKLRRLWRLALIGGVLQVGTTAAAAYSISVLVGLPTPAAILVGFITALSSTAIVLRGLQQRGEVDAPHGRLILGILVFQDISVVPIMLLLPLLAGSGAGLSELLLSLGKSIGIVTAVLLTAVLIAPRVLRLVAQTRQRQLFVLAVFVVSLGTAWLVTRSGASLAIGAFLAGLVVAGSEYRHQALSDLIAFRDIFASLFFVSIGMLLSPTLIVANLAPILMILLAILAGKSLMVFVSALFTGMPARASLIAALALAQVGEFSFVLIHSAQGTGLLSAAHESNLVSAAILSMFITPFFMAYGPRLAAGLGRFARLKQQLAVDTVDDASDTICRLKDHVIVAGYGFAGRELCLTLRRYEIPFVVVDINIENVQHAARETPSALFGDITSEEVLSHLGVECARELVILINDPVAAAVSVREARRLAPDLMITVRTAYLLDVQVLLDAGANQVIAAEREAAVQIVTDILDRHRITTADIGKEAREIRTHTDASP